MAKRRKSNPNFAFSDNVPIEFENIYAIINYLQMERKECAFMAKPSDTIIIEHILKDSEIKFARMTLKKGIRYTLEPPPEMEISEDRFVFDEELPDEIIEDGQCF